MSLRSLGIGIGVVGPNSGAPDAGGISLTKLALQKSAVSQSTNYNFANVTTPRTGLIVVALAGIGAASTLNSLSIQGLAANLHSGQADQGGIVFIASRQVTATTFDIDIDPNGNTDGMVCQPFLLENHLSDTPSAVQTAATASSGLTINVAAGGLVIAAAKVGSVASDSQTWATLGVEDCDESSGNVSGLTVAHGIFGEAQTPTATISISPGAAIDGMACATWDPA